MSSSSFYSFIDFSERDFFFLFFFSCSINHISLIVFHSISKSWMKCNNSINIKRWFFVISLICLMRVFSAFRVITSFVCISSRFIRQIFLNWALTRFFSLSFSFYNFATITCFAFFLMSFKLSISNRKRLRKNFFLFSFFCLDVCLIYSFVSLNSELTIICLMLLTKSSKSFFRTESFHCMLSAILRSQWFFNSCWISIKSWVYCSSDNVNFVVSTYLLKCFNCLMYCFLLINHISNFSKTCRIIDVLNVLFLISSNHSRITQLNISQMTWQQRFEWSNRVNVCKIEISLHLMIACSA
jgi:hypothetical protein